jgi:hypothetical protein
MKTYRRTFPYLLVSMLLACGSPDDDMNMQMNGTDTAAPTFAGASGALPADATPGVTKGSIKLSWQAATDDKSAADKIVYLIYQAEKSGGQSFASPSVTSKAGATSVDINDLEVGKTYYYVVRAKDEAGNIDKNTVEVKATIVAAVPTDTKAPMFAGLGTAVASTGKVTLSWTAATDDVTPAAGIVYHVYQADKAGGQMFGTPSYTTQAGATSFDVTGLKPAAEYFFVVRAKDAAGNIDTNVVEKNVKTGAPSFTTDVYPILSASCMRCHGTPGSAKLDLSSAATAFTNLVSQASTQCTTDQRVIPNAPEKSYLIWKLDGAAPMGACYKGERMPKGGMLSAADMSTIRAWIADGAKNN